MSELILKPLLNSPVLGITLTLPLPQDDAIKDLKDKAKAAADGIGAAPEFVLTKDNLPSTVLFSLLELKLSTNREIPKDAFESFRVCVIQSQDSIVDGDLILKIVSGTVIINAAKAASLSSIIPILWPTDLNSQFGEIEKLVLVANGLIIETKKTKGVEVERRRFRLIKGDRLQPEPDEDTETRLVWEQIAWGDTSLDVAIYKTPSDRLKEVQKASDTRMNQKELKQKSPPVSRVDKFDIATQREGAIFIEVRHSNTSSGTVQTDVRERVTPSWGLRLGRADWSPKSLTVVGNNLENAILRYSSDDDPFYGHDANDIDASLKTSLEWSWENVSQPILPLLKELATSPPILSTGELPGASANSPFLWQMGKLAVDKDASEKTEPGIWIRYRVDPLPKNEKSITQESNGNGGLSRPLRFENFRHSDGSAIEHWRLDLSLFSNINQTSQDTSTPQIWLDLKPVESGRHTIMLTFLNALIRAASPKILALRSPLTDPGALPNQSDRFAGLHPAARILFANDRTEPASNLQDRCALQMTLANAGEIRLNAWKDAPDVVIAYIPGPVAGIDLISRSRGNLVPAPNTNNPNTPPLPTRIREYESGRVAVHLIKSISLKAESTQAQADELTDTVRVGNIDDLFMPSSETVAALLPWALSRIKENKFDEHQFAPFHRNLILEALDWELSAPDRHDPQLDSAPPLLDPGLQEPDNRSRDYRHEEALLNLEQAVRDRFAFATSQPLADNDVQTLANWLPGVSRFQFEGQTLTPQVELKLADSGSLTALPSLEFNWQNSDPAIFPPQTLSLTPSPSDFTVDLDANTLICPTHGLRDGMGIQLASTGNLPSGLSTETTYCVFNSAQDTFQLKTLAGSVVDIKDVGSALNSWLLLSIANLNFTVDPSTDILTSSSAHELTNGTAIQLSSTGQLPGGLARNTTYYVVNSVPPNIFQITSTLAGKPINITDAGTPDHSWLVLSNKNFTADASTDKLLSLNHGLANDTAIQLTSRGNLPGGLIKDTTSYVINSTKDTFQLASTQAGSPIAITDSGQAINSWFVVSNNWLSAWLRWTEGQPNKPQLQVDRDGQNAARLATNSDVPLLEYRTPIAAVAAGWLAGKQWIIFAINSPKPQIFAWEPLTEEKPQKIEVSIDENIPISFLTIDASSDILKLAVVQQSKCTVFKFTASSSDPIIGRVSPQQPILLNSKITTVRLLAERLFIGTELVTVGSETLFVYSFDTTGKPVEITKQKPGGVVALDVRAAIDGDLLTVAVATKDLEIKLYSWTKPFPLEPTFSPKNPLAPQSPVLTIKNIGADEEISAISIQPLKLNVTTSGGTTTTQAYSYVYAAVQKPNGTGYIVAWKVIPISSSISIDSLEEKPLTEETPGERILRTLTEPVSFLLIDPVLNDDDNLEGGAPNAQWLAVVTSAKPDGRTSIITCPVRTWNNQSSVSTDAIDMLRPQFNSSVRFGDHEGSIVATALIPGRSQHSPNSPPSSESRFATWVVTGGKDGTVRVWDPETGFERFRHTVMPSNAWLDMLGIVRRKIEPTPVKIEPAQTSGFWIEPIDVPTSLEGNSGNEQLLALSTLGEPFTLIKDSISNTAMRFLCQNLHLKNDSGTWKPIQFTESSTRHTFRHFTESSTRHTFRHGVYGCDGGGAEDPMPRIGGMSVEIISLKEIVFFPLGEDLNAGQVVNPKTIVFEALLSNPTFPAPDGSSVPFSLGTPTISIHFKRGLVSDDFQLSLEESRFDWSFLLTEQLPLGKASVLPGRLARIMGKVTLDGDRHLKLEPEVAQAEILGTLRPVPNPPALVFDQGNKNAPKQIRFRESLTDDEAKLEQSGNLLPSASTNQDAQIVATSIGTDPLGEKVVLIASQAADPNQKGSAVLADLETGQTRTHFAEGLKQIQLIVEDVTSNSKRLTIVGVAEDGTVRVQRLWDIKRAGASITETEIEPSMQNWKHYVLPSPAENVQVFKIEKEPRLWFLARCRDGSAWLWDSIHGNKYDLSLRDTAVTTIVFGPQIPIALFDPKEEKYQHWRSFFGRFDPELVTSFDTVIAIGGADGSVHLYAIANGKAPVLVRSLFTLNEPIQSLSLAIDEKSSEARTLVKIGNIAVGLVLLACDSNNPVQLIEILSGLSLTPPDRISLPAPLQMIGLLGEIFFDEKLRIILKTRDKEEFSISTLSKEILSEDNVFSDPPNSLELSTVSPEWIDQIFSKNQLLTVVFSRKEGIGWRVYERNDSKFELRATNNTTILNATTCEVSLSSFNQRYIVTILPNGALETWVQKDPFKPEEWIQVKGSNLNLPAHIDGALLGLVTTPMVACYGKPAHLGHIWDINDGISTTSWPKEIGLIDANTPVAITSFNGIPHLAVAQPTDITVWNLATGQLIYRLGVEQISVSIDIATDLDQVWLLVGKKPNIEINEISYEIFNVFSNLKEDVPDFKGNYLDIDARFIRLSSGLHLFATHRVNLDAGGTKTATFKTKIFRSSLADRKVILTQILGSHETTPTSSFTDGQFRLLNVTTFTNQQFWLLALVGTQPLVVPIIPAVQLIFEFPPSSVGTAEVTAAAFDLDPDPSNRDRPLVWTVDAQWNSVTSWSFPDPSTGGSVPTPGTPIVESGRPARLNVNESPVHLQTMRYNGQTRLIAVSSGGLSIWDLLDKTVVQTTLLEQAIPRIVPMVLSAAVGVDTKTGCVRFWDQYTGRLRQRLLIKNADLAEPNQLVVIPSPTRPLLIIAGASKGVALVDLYSNGVVTLAKEISISSLSAALMLPEGIDQNERLVVAGIVNGIEVQIWRTLLGQESSLFDGVLNLSGFPPTPQAIELLHLENRTLIAVADSNEFKIFDIPQDTSKPITLATSSDVGITPSNPAFKIINIRLSHAIEQDCVLVALALNSTSNTRVELHDLPLRNGLDTFQRPATRWVKDKEIDDKLLPGVMALVCNNDGSRIVAGTEVFRTASLLRIYNYQPPRFDLPVEIFLGGNADSFLKGRITPSRRLDLQISLDPQKLGLPEKVVRLTARANLIQGSYSCFMIDGIDYGDFRLTGALVLWDNLNLLSRDFQGLLLIDDTTIITRAKIELPSKSGGFLPTFDGFGTRVRLRAIPFDNLSTTIDKLSWREVLSWYLLSNSSTQLKTEWHLADAILDVPAKPSNSSLQIVQAHLSSSDADSIQGNLLVTLKRNVAADEEYTLSLNPTTYAVHSFDDLGDSKFDTTKNDFVYPAGTKGSLGLAFDLVEPPNNLSNQFELFQFATLLADGGIAKLLEVQPDELPLDLNTGINVTRALPKHSISVPQLIHREAQGARIRGRWPSVFETLKQPTTTGKELPQKQWLLSPVAVTPQGAMVLTQNLIIRPKGKPLDWNRLQTEDVLAVYRDGSVLFASPSSKSDVESPSIVNLLTKTVLRSSGAIARNSIALFNDEQVQSYALDTGRKGVLLVRTSDARGRVNYRIVNSPYYAITPLTVIPSIEALPAPAADLGSEIFPDPRLLTPRKVSELKLKGTPRYEPVMASGDRPSDRAFQIFGKVSEKTVVHLAEVPALKATDKPIAPINFENFDKSDTFLPLTLQLGYGLTKPGGTFHQMIQCLSKENSTLSPSPLITSPLITFVRREPQQFIPPLRAAIQLNNPTLRQKQNNQLELELPWTEILGSITLQNNELINNAEFTIEADVTNPSNFTIKEKEKVVKWIIRLGEKIQILDENLPVPFTPFQNGKPVDSFDLFMFTRLRLEEDRTLPTGTIVKPILMVSHGSKFETISLMPLDSIFTKIPEEQDSYAIWQLKRDANNLQIFLSWLKELENINEFSLNLIWWDSTPIADQSIFDSVPTLIPLKLRDVVYEPQSPRLAAVLRLPRVAGQGLLAPTHEFTLFYGPSASAKGITPVIKTFGDRALIQFVANDEERLILANPLPPAQVDCGLSIVKFFEDGATLTTSKLIQLNSGS